MNYNHDVVEGVDVRHPTSVKTVSVLKRTREIYLYLSQK